MGQARLMFCEFAFVSSELVASCIFCVLSALHKFMVSLRAENKFFYPIYCSTFNKMMSLLKIGLALLFSAGHFFGPRASLNCRAKDRIPPHSFLIEMVLFYFKKKLTHDKYIIGHVSLKTHDGIFG